MSPMSDTGANYSVTLSPFVEGSIQYYVNAIDNENNFQISTTQFFDVVLTAISLSVSFSGSQ
jgi:hypothetical protein